MAADLPAFSAADETWLQRLVLGCEHLPQRMPSFLQQHFFNEAAGRALILQPGRRFGYFYLKTAIYECPERLSAEIKSLMDLCALLARLREHRLLYLFDSASAQAEPMFFLSDLFVEPKPASAHVVLNKRGDYTFEPDTIRSAGDDVLYRGVRLDGEIYEFVHRAVRGIFTMTNEARAQLGAARLPAAPAPAPPAGAGGAAGRWGLAKQPWHSVARHAALALAAGIGGYVLQSHHSLAAPARPAPAQPGKILVPAAVAGAPPVAPAAQAAAPVPQQPAAREWSYGVDVSKWNGRGGADVLREPGLAFAFARASYALERDPSFAANWKRMADRGLVRGAYHFFSMAADPALQASHLVQALGRRGARDLCAAVDFEEGSLPARSSRPPVATVQSALLEHLQHLEGALGCRPILYTNLSMGNHYLDDPRFAGYPLWIADWVSESAPTVPKAWASAGYRFWQRSATHAFSDAPAELTDFDVFAGSGEQLASMLATPSSHVQPANK